MMPFRELAIVLCAVIPISSAGAAPHSPYLGRWFIAGASPAPWSVAGDPATAPVPAPIVGKAIVYERSRIAGPRLLACRRPNYQLRQVPPEGLFQGGLTSPAAQAAAPARRRLPWCRERPRWCPDRRRDSAPVSVPAPFPARKRPRRLARGSRSSASTGR